MPTWSRAAHLEIGIDEPIRSISLEGEYIAIPLSDSIIVWDWQADQWATVNVADGNVRMTRTSPSMRSIDITMSICPLGPGRLDDVFPFICLAGL